jgi:hypothetical protein
VLAVKLTSFVVSLINWIPPILVVVARGDDETDNTPLLILRLFPTITPPDVLVVAVGNE